MTDRKEQLIKFYETRLKQMLSDGDFKRLLPDCKVLEYKDLKNYTNLYELLPNNKDYAIILTEFKPNTGHWTCITRDGTKFYWMDSYGVAPDGENKFIPAMMRRLLGENDKDLTRLIKATKAQGGSVDYNKKKYQVLRDDINTCGRWVYVFIYMFLMNNTPEDFRRIMKQLKENTGKPYDILITEYI